MILIFALPLMSFLFLSAFALDEWEEKRQRAKEEAKRQKEFEDKQTIMCYNKRKRGNDK